MGGVSNGRVYLGLDYGWDDADSDEEPHPLWYGHCEFGGEDTVENGPEFLDASDAVRWWQDRGAKWILGTRSRPCRPDRSPWENDAWTRTR